MLSLLEKGEIRWLPPGKDWLMEHCFTFQKNSFGLFFDLLTEFGTVYAPVRVSEQSFSFSAVSSAKDIAFEALRTILPPKKYFYPARETIVTFSGHDVRGEINTINPQVLFGVHPCDLAGLDVIDNLFSAEPKDSHYLSRRQNTFIVGLSCMPDKHCFCQSMGTDSPKSGYDIFLTDIGEEFFVQVNSPLGLKQIDKRPSLFEAANDRQKRKYKEFWADRSKAFSTGFKTNNLPAIIDMEWDNPVWEELGKRCLSCGNCTPVCPTCYCFDLVDVVSLSGDSGQRHREWDSCQFSGFAKVAGGFNFRPGPVDRLKFWYRHKLHGFDDAYGFPTCVGCGRCTVSCPAEIDDIVGVVLRLTDNSGEKENDR